MTDALRPRCTCGYDARNNERDDDPKCPNHNPQPLVVTGSDGSVAVTTGYPDNNPKSVHGAKKPPVGFIPPAALLHEAAAFADGAVKYGAYNWRLNGVSAMVYLHAAGRHLLEFLDREDFDPTSNVHHLGHARACLGIVLDAFETGNLIDDRPKPGAAGELIRRWEKQGNLKPGGTK